MTAHRPAQIVRLSAIVLSGAASLCLTVAAGAYIVHQMPDLAPPEQAAPTDTPTHPRPFVEDPAGQSVELALFTGDTVLAGERSVPATTRTAITAQQSGVSPTETALTGRFGIGGAYVGAQVAPARTDSVTVTVDTNLVSTAAQRLGLSPDAAAVTALSTEFDVHDGELVVVLSHPGLGTHTFVIDAPAPLSPLPERAATVGV
ncbi:hypothetical protein [Nocardia lasii]|uniref:GerMN domain-containing protein n=1 Tax=Nocardia lasii TaxID=1616107 RepID=A0ABW1JQ41_9NOCA